MPNNAAKLEIRKGGILVQEFTLGRAIVTVGRAPDNTLVLSDDLTVSRHHAQVSQDGDQWSFTDLGSAAGTFVNEAKLAPHQPHPLAAGDLVQIGSFELRLQLIQGAQGSPQGRMSAQKTTVFAMDSPFK